MELGHLEGVPQPDSFGGGKRSPGDDPAMILHDPARGGGGEVQRNSSGNIHLAHTPPYALEFGLSCDNFGDTCAKGQNEGSSKNIPTSEMINLEWIWILRPKHFGDIDRPDIQKHLIDT